MIIELLPLGGSFYFYAMKDYLIVGAGLAGLAFAEAALASGKTIHVLDDASQDASSVAAGLYNPVAIKRLKAIPDAAELLRNMFEFHSRVGEGKLIPLPLLRRFHSVEEQNTWFEAADSPGLLLYLSPNLVRKSFPGFESPFGFGEVLNAGYLSTREFIAGYRKILSDEGLLMNQTMEHESIVIEEDQCRYGDISYRYIVFAEGFGLHQNPYFNHLPLNGTKGEILLIRTAGLQLDSIVNAGIFILPLGDGIFRVGATYGHQDKTNLPTAAGRLELEEKLREVLNCDYEVIGHEAGVRPTVRDRQPLLGRHTDYPRLAVLNGLGTRGVLFAPTLAKKLFEHLEYGLDLPWRYDIRRFKRPAFGSARKD